MIEKISIPTRPYDPTKDPRPDCFKFRPGVYTCLRRDQTQFMTDLYDEWWTQREAMAEARKRGGNILITGLGLGLVAEAILRDKNTAVRHITIVEAASDVIALIGLYLQQKYPGRITIVPADAFTWTPERGEHYTVGWHDIWPDPHAASNIPEMQLLEDRYRPWCDWQGCWPQAYQLALQADS